MKARLALPAIAVLTVILAALVWLATTESRTSRTFGDEGASPVASPEGPATSLSPGIAAQAGRAAVSDPIDPASEPTVEVEIQTLSFFHLDRQIPVPDVSVVMGLANLYASEPREFARVRTDERGRARVALPLREVEAMQQEPDGRIWARVVEPGYQQRMVREFLAAEDGVLRIRLVAERGATLIGRVVDALGEEVKARVTARNRRDGERVVASSSPWEPPGRFEVHFAGPGTLDVLADTEGRGTGAARDVAVDGMSGPAYVEIVVQGPGSLRGRVRDSSGRPAAGIDLLALVSEADDGSGTLDLEAPTALRMRLEGRGALTATARTDSEGRFEIAGLREDRFHIRASPEVVFDRIGESPRYTKLLTPVAVPNDGPPVELVLDRPHLVVKLAGTWSLPIRLEEGVHQKKPSPTWFETPRVVVALTREEAPEDGGQVLLPGRHVGGAEYVFEVEEGRNYVVGLLGGPSRWNPKEVEVPRGATRVEVALQVAENAGYGWIVLSASAADGEPFRSPVAVRIEDPGTGMPLVAEDRIWEIQWPLRFQMPEGEYRVVVEGAPSVEFFRGTLGTPRSGGRYVETLRVARGATVEVQAQIPEGARVRLSVRGEVRPEDVEAFARRHPRADKEYATFWTGRASVVLIADSGWPESVQFTYEEAGTSAPGTHLTGTIPLGVPSVSQVLPAGRFRLEARMPGGRIASQEVVLAAGQVTDVALDLGP